MDIIIIAQSLCFALPLETVTLHHEVDGTFSSSSISKRRKMRVLRDLLLGPSEGCLQLSLGIPWWEKRGAARGAGDAVGAGRARAAGKVMLRGPCYLCLLARFVRSRGDVCAAERCPEKERKKK